MINSLWLADFKSFSRVRLRMGPFTVIVGANASGKSNLRDAFRFLAEATLCRTLLEGSTAQAVR